MARRVSLILTVLGVCLSLHNTFARSLPPVPSYTFLKQYYQGLLNSGNGDNTLETLLARRILISRVTSTAGEFGFTVDSSKNSVWRVASRLAANPSASGAFFSLMQNPSDSEIQEALTGLVRDYIKYRERSTQLDDDEALLVKEVESRLESLAPTTPIPTTSPTPPPYPEPRFFFFFTSVPPEVNTEGLEGIAAMAHDVVNNIEEEGFISKLQRNMFINSVITTYSFITVEFLSNIGLGDVTSVGTLVADMWLAYELMTEVRAWAEEGCYFPSAWPFYYFYPEHCRKQREEKIRRQQEKKAAEAAVRNAANSAGNSAGEANGNGAANGEANGAESGNGAANGAAAENHAENSNGVANGAVPENGGENGNGAENGSDAENGADFDTENAPGDDNGAGNEAVAENGTGNGTAAAGDE